ncbi:MAG TPA: hypothetical protein PLB96_12345 [Syntrophales bacterium]|nr:hypothetical protein [Syntrophales bacterium]
MKRVVLAISAVLLLVVACGGSKPIRDWVNISHSQMETFKRDALTGRTSTGGIYYGKAIEEIKKSGNVDLLAKAYLIRMAIQVSLLEDPNEEDFLKVDAVESVAENKSYYYFLTGRFDRVDEKALPATYRPLQNALRNGDSSAEIAKLLEKIDDSLSRLIGAGIVVRRGNADEATLLAALGVASEQGWKAAVILYLGQLQSYYERTGQTAKAAATRARLSLIE